ncbi:hypothetical protein [Polymorphospora rubra]|uniref:hypothetical protein n=1 Tax=Polymorphospora rubra TaxID=338584 RepID=UPI0033F5EE75
MIARCSLGRVLVATVGRNVCVVLLGRDSAALRPRLSRRFPWAELSDPDPQLRKVVLRAGRRA